MKSIFDNVSFDCSMKVTKAYSTSFSSAVKMLAPSIRQDIYNIYGFVRFADEIVDSFHGYDKEKLLKRLKAETYEALEDRISLNPILHSFQETVRKYDIDIKLINQFLHSMEMDLHNNTYNAHAYNESLSANLRRRRTNGRDFRPAIRSAVPDRKLFKPLPIFHRLLQKQKWRGLPPSSRKDSINLQIRSARLSRPRFF